MSVADLAAVADQHVMHEYVHKDVEATLATMTAEPSILFVPTLAGGVGRERVRRFYRDEWIANLPPDMAFTLVSRTIGEDRLVAELIMNFTHTNEMPAVCPGIAPTGRRVEVPTVIVMGFEGDKVAYERVYWEHASLLAQLGLLDALQLPVRGAELAQRLMA